MILWYFFHKKLFSYEHMLNGKSKKYLTELSHIRKLKELKELKELRRMSCCLKKYAKKTVVLTSRTTVGSDNFFNFNNFWTC